MNFLDGYVQKITPLARDIGVTAQAYAERIISRLDAIHDAVESEEFTEIRFAERINTVGGQTSSEPIFEVPRGETWELEYFLGWSSDVGGATILHYLQTNKDDPSSVIFGNTTDTVKSTSGMGLQIPSGTSVWLRSTGGTGIAYIQLKRKKRKPAKNRAVTGTQEPTPEYFGRGVEESRHSAPGVQMKSTEPGVMTR